MKTKTDFGRFAFTLRYVTALCIIALLSTLAYINLNYLINSQSNDAKVIHTSGQQAMLSQMVGFYAIYYQTKQLESSILLMREHHRFLLEQKMSEDIKNIYFGEINLDKKIELFLENAERFNQIRDGKSLTYVLLHSQKLLEDLNTLGDRYIKESEEKIERLRDFELFIYTMTIITLLLEALLIFIPANISINRKTKEITKEKDYSNMVIESSVNAIISLDNDYLVKTYNTTAQKIFGYTKDEIKKADDILKIVPAEYEVVHKLGFVGYVNVFCKEHENELFEFEAQNRAGEKFPVRVSFATSGDAFMVITVQDITKEKLNALIVQKQSKFAALGDKSCA